MERGVSVEVFEREDKSYYFIVQPRTAIEGLRRYLAAQEGEVTVFEPNAVGDLGIHLLNGKSLDDVMRGAATIESIYQEQTAQTADVQL